MWSRAKWVSIVRGWKTRAALGGRLEDLARDALKESDGQHLFIEVRDEKLLRLCLCLQVTAMG